MHHGWRKFGIRTFGMLKSTLKPEKMLQFVYTSKMLKYAPKFNASWLEKILEFVHLKFSNPTWTGGP